MAAHKKAHNIVFVRPTGNSSEMLTYLPVFFGPLIDKEIKKKRPEQKLKGPSVFTISVSLSVGLSVCVLSTCHRFYRRKLIF